MLPVLSYYLTASGTLQYTLLTTVKFDYLAGPPLIQLQMPGALHRRDGQEHQRGS